MGRKSPRKAGFGGKRGGRTKGPEGKDRELEMQRRDRPSSSSSSEVMESDDVVQSSSSYRGNVEDESRRRRVKRKIEELGLGGSRGESEVEEGTRSPEPRSHNMVVRFEREGGVRTIAPLTLSCLLQDRLGNIRFAKVLGDGNLLIGCESELQVEKVKSWHRVGEVRVRQVVRVGEARQDRCKGVVSGIPLGEGLEQIRADIGKIASARRLTRGAKREETESVLLEFESKEMPSHVYIGYLRYAVRAFVPLPMRCYRCQGFGHQARGCKAGRRCARCGGDHDYGACGAEVQPSCCNCGGAHTAAFRGCAVLKHEAAIQKVRVTEKKSYVEAVKAVGPRIMAANPQGETVQIAAGVLREVGEKLMVERKNLVTFVAGVVNAILDVKSKTERIKIVVRAAVHHLGLRAVTWEEVRDELDQVKDQGPERQKERGDGKSVPSGASASGKC